MARIGVVGQEIQLRIKFYQDGNLFDPFLVNSVNIYSETPGGTSLVTIPVVRLSIGFYQATYDIPLSLAPGTYYDEWVWTAEEGMVSNTQRYSFELTLDGAQAGAGLADPLAVHAGCRPKPSWIHLPGIRLVEDVGNGMGLRLNWMEAATTSAVNQIHYNIYKGNTLYEALASYPFAITTARTAIINTPPGNLHYFMVRATEFNPAEYDLGSMTQIGVNVYQYPARQELLSDIDSYGASIVVADNSEFPEKGFLKINFEVIKYSAKEGTTIFVVEDTERGAFVTFPEAHVAGETIELFKGVEDGNSIVFEETAAWHQDNGIPRNTTPEAEGEFNVDEDGYRENADDIVTPDFDASDASSIDFPYYDYCGYHRPSIQSTFSGDACLGSYVGGEFNGSRGFNFQDRSLAQLDAMLQVTGEPVILLRRKQTGRRCRCVTLRREQPRFRCQYCYSTTFDGGYDRYVNPRAISESFDNVQGFIMVRVSPWNDDLKLEQSQGLIQPTELTAWTINVPTIKDRDIIVRFNIDGTEEFRYEVLDVTRNRIVLAQSGKQEFRMRRQDKTDVIYQYNAII